MMSVDFQGLNNFAAAVHRCFAVPVVCMWISWGCECVWVFQKSECVYVSGVRVCVYVSGVSVCSSQVYLCVFVSSGVCVYVNAEWRLIMWEHIPGHVNIMLVLASCFVKVLVMFWCVRACYGWRISEAWLSCLIWLAGFDSSDVIEQMVMDDTFSVPRPLTTLTQFLNVHPNTSTAIVFCLYLSLVNTLCVLLFDLSMCES